jgi:hypothetical protein
MLLILGGVSDVKWVTYHAYTIDTPHPTLHLTSDTPPSIRIIVLVMVVLVSEYECPTYCMAVTHSTMYHVPMYSG